MKIYIITNFEEKVFETYDKVIYRDDKVIFQNQEQQIEFFIKDIDYLKVEE